MSVKSDYVRKKAIYLRAKGLNKYKTASAAALPTSISTYLVLCLCFQLKTWTVQTLFWGQCKSLLISECKLTYSGLLLLILGQGTAEFW